MNKLKGVNRWLALSGLLTLGIFAVLATALLVPGPADAHEGDSAYSHHIKHNLGNITDQTRVRWVFPKIRGSGGNKRVCVMFALDENRTVDLRFRQSQHPATVEIIDRITGDSWQTDDTSNEGGHIKHTAHPVVTLPGSTNIDKSGISGYLACIHHPGSHNNSAYPDKVHLRVEVSKPTEDDAIPADFPERVYTPAHDANDPVCDYKPHSDADCTATTDGTRWNGWIDYAVDEDGDPVPGQAGQEWIKFDATAGETYTVDVRGFNRYYRAVPLSSPTIPCWYANRSQLEFPHLNYTQNSLPWSEAPFYSCDQYEDDNYFGSSSTSVRITGIFNEDGEKVKGGKLACPSPTCKARVRITPDETGPLFVGVRFAGYWYMFGNYNVRINSQ